MNISSHNLNMSQYLVPKWCYTPTRFLIEGEILVTATGGFMHIIERSNYE